MLALHGGAPTIVDGCLTVDELVVVWHADRIAEARQAIAAAKAGSTTRVELGGGGMSLDEGAKASDFPAAVTKACPNAKGVWFQAP